MPEIRTVPFSKEDIISIIRDAIQTGVIVSPTTILDPEKTYILKVVKGVLTLVEETVEESDD